MDLAHRVGQSVCPLAAGVVLLVAMSGSAAAATCPAELTRWPDESVLLRADEISWIARQTDLPSTVPHLLEALNDPHPFVAYEAREGLRRLGWKWVIEEAGERGWRELESDLREGAGERCVPARTEEHITRLVPDTRVEWRVVAVEALAELGGERALELLREAVADRSQDVRFAVAGALGAFDEDAALAALEPLWADESQWVRSRAVEAARGARGEGARQLRTPTMADFGDSQANALLEWLLAHHSLLSQAAAEPADLGGAAAVPLLLPLLYDSSVDVRLMAAQVIAQFGTPKDLRRLERWFIEDADLESRHRQRFLEALPRFGRRSAIPLICRALSANDSETLIWASYALARTGGAEAERLLQAQLDHDDVFVRRNAIRSLGHLGGSSVSEFLARAFTERPLDPRDHRTLAEVLTELDPERALFLLRDMMAVGAGEKLESLVIAFDHGKYGGAVVEVLRDGLAASRTVPVRISSASALRFSRHDSAFSALAFAVQDSVAEVRLQAVDTLGYVRQRPGARPLLKLAAADPDSEVSEKAQETLDWMRN